MYILSDYIALETDAWNTIHAWVSNSTITELLTRLIYHAGDIHTLGEIYENMPKRGLDLASSKTSLTCLIGHNVNLLPDDPIDAGLFLKQRKHLITWWRKTSDAFKHMNHGLKEYKYTPQSTDPHYRPGNNPAYDIYHGKAVLEIDSHQLHRCFMPLPMLAIVLPIFRYVPYIF